jgi:hypothetical protein
MSRTKFTEPPELSSRPAPCPGEFIAFEVMGKPPIKDRHFSIRNKRHPLHERFILLRNAATDAMAGRKCYDGMVSLSVIYFNIELNRSLVDYLGGIMDTIDGSHGLTFTYLPIIIQDDYQVTDSNISFVLSAVPKYKINCRFL